MNKIIILSILLAFVAITTDAQFVFGAGHLIGEHGVIQMLRTAGYEVEQITIKTL